MAAHVTSTGPRFGPYFALEVRTDLAGWHPLASLSHSDLLADLVEATRRRMGDVGVGRSEIRAVASTVSLGLFARIVSPFVGAWAAGEATAPPDPDSLWLTPASAGLMPLATNAGLVDADPAGAVDNLVLPLLSPIGRRFSLSVTILRGNVSAAVAGACEVVASVEPGLLARTQSLRAALLSRGPLRGSGTVAGPFVRNSCCLLYQLPGHGLCGNCVLLAPRTRTGEARSAHVAHP